MSTTHKAIPVAPVSSNNLLSYRLPKRTFELLRVFDKMDAYQRMAGSAALCVRLFGKDYKDLDAEIARQSNGQYRLPDIRYRGLPILSADE